MYSLQNNCFTDFVLIIRLSELGNYDVDIEMKFSELYTNRTKIR